jgi:hypothetical protein
MKKDLLIAILLFGLLCKSYSQDRIITMNKDTIDCKINKITHSTIFFDMTTKGVKSFGKLPMTTILNYTISGKAAAAEQKTINSEPFERFRFGMNGGLGSLLASSKKAEDNMVSLGFTQSQVKAYYKDLRSGIYANADLTYLITPSYGIGIKYEFFDNNSSMEGFVDPNDGVNLIYTTYKEQIYVNFLGPSFFYQQFIRKQKSLKLYYAYSIGIATYRDEAEYLSGYYLLTGKNVATDLSLGLEYCISHHISLAADLSIFFSSIRRMKISDGSTSSTIKLDKDNYENLSRLDLSLGFRFYIWKK